MSRSRPDSSWPRAAARYPYPSMEVLLRQSIPLMKEPTPLPPLLVEKHAEYLVILSTAVVNLEAAEALAEKAAADLAASGKELPSFNRWKDKTNKAGLHKRLTAESDACQKVVTLRRTLRDEIMKKGEELVRLMLLQARMEAAYAEYMAELKEGSP